MSHIEEKTAGHNSLLDLYRFVFSCMIVCHHAIHLPEAQQVPFQGGYVCVEFFFILSGCLLAKSAWKERGGVNEKSIAYDTVHQVIKRYMSLFYFWLPAFLASFLLQHWNRMADGDFVSTFKEFLFSLFELAGLSMSGINQGVVKWHFAMWYVSALLISIMIIYPIMRRYRYYFTMIAAPLIACFGYGWLSVNYRAIGAIEEWNGIVQAGMIRGLAGLSVGCIVFQLTNIRLPFPKTKRNDVIFTLIEMVLLFAALFIIYMQNNSLSDFFLVALFAILIYLSFAWDGAFNRLCDNHFCRFLGRFSVPLYVSHTLGFYLQREFWIPLEWKYRYLLYIASAFVFACLDYLFGNLMKKIFSKA